LCKRGCDKFELRSGRLPPNRPGAGGVARLRRQLVGGHVIWRGSRPLWSPGVEGGFDAASQEVRSVLVTHARSAQGAGRAQTAEQLTGRHPEGRRGAARARGPRRRPEHPGPPQGTGHVCVECTVRRRQVLQGSSRKFLGLRSTAAHTRSSSRARLRAGAKAVRAGNLPTTSLRSSGQPAEDPSLHGQAHQPQGDLTRHARQPRSVLGRTVPLAMSITSSCGDARAPRRTARGARRCSSASNAQ
jgi:hypothetical protein